MSYSLNLALFDRYPQVQRLYRRCLETMSSAVNLALFDGYPHVQEILLLQKHGSTVHYGEKKLPDARVLQTQGQKELFPRPV